MFTRYDYRYFTFKRNFYNRWVMPSIMKYQYGGMLRESTARPFIDERTLKPDYYWPELIH